MSAKSAKLAALLAESAAPIVAANGTASVKTAPTATTAVVNGAPVKHETTVNRGAVKTASTVMKIDGFEIAFSKGTLDPALLKATVSRATTNPWYDVVTWTAAQVPGYLTIRRTDATIKSPVSKIDSAINRARKQGVKNFHKLEVRSSAADKGVWYLIRNA